MENIYQILERELSEICPEDRAKFERDFESDREIKKLRSKLQEQERGFKIVQSIQTRQRIAEVKLRVLREMKKNMIQKVEKVSLLKLQIPQEPLQTIIHDIVAIHMTCDILESYSNEIEYLLQKHAPEWHIESFNNILKLGKQATEQINWIIRNTDLMEFDSWGNICDDFINSIRNKAAKLMRQSAEKKAREKQSKEKEA